MNRIKKLRQDADLKQTDLAKILSVSQAALSGYETGKYEPDFVTLKKIADYFEVSIDYVLGRDTKKDAPALTKKDERDIARDLEAFIADMDQGDLMFDGDPMTPEAKESVIAAMKLGLEAAKMKNKERFTPKKYRKDAPET